MQHIQRMSSINITSKNVDIEGEWNSVVLSVDVLLGIHI